MEEDVDSILQDLGSDSPVPGAASQTSSQSVVSVHLCTPARPTQPLGFTSYQAQLHESSTNDSASTLKCFAELAEQLCGDVSSPATPFSISQVFARSGVKPQRSFDVTHVSPLALFA